MIPRTLTDPPHRTVVGHLTVSTCRLPSRSWTRPVDERPRWETIIIGEPSPLVGDVEEWTYSPEKAQALHERRVEDAQRFIRLNRKTIADVSDDDLERAHYHLSMPHARLSAEQRDIIARITADDLGSDRARNLFAALNEFDQAGPRAPWDASDHERVYCKIAAVLMDAILADRQADPALVAELSASVAPTDMASLGVSRG